MTRSPERSRMRRFAACCALALAATGAAQADDAYPSKPITIVVPFSPGSATDTSARILTEKLGPRLGVPIVIENKPGASGTIGSSTAARAAPD
ncbi:Bug family tripartite tricarboxylate transporter substrate binding protein, partial [Achromobacter insuavis]